MSYVTPLQVYKHYNPDSKAGPKFAHPNCYFGEGVEVHGSDVQYNLDGIHLDLCYGHRTIIAKALRDEDLTGEEFRDLGDKRWAKS